MNTLIIKESELLVTPMVEILSYFFLRWMSEYLLAVQAAVPVLLKTV